ncbi:MAG: GNAT family N-acetyltransferase [Clostridia bacterium]|nr:GNAT family N-acetyltransferase [Clostridia bacterium]
MVQLSTVQSATSFKGNITPTGIHYIEVTDPDSLEAQQALLMCRIIFGLGNEEVADLYQQLRDSQCLRPNKMHLVVAKHEGKAVGCVLFYHLAEVNMGFMDYIVVAPSYQRKGIGRSLYNAAIEILERDSQGIKGMLFEVHKVSQGLDKRKNFFLNIGAIPIDLSFYPLGKEVTHSGILVMFHPWGCFRMTWPNLVKVFDNLSAVLNH